MRVIIEKIQINSFGKLKNVVVTAEKGINILSAPNESGKSTLASFIKFAFYGFAGTRSHKLTENERKLYTPWEGEICEGAIAFTADKEKYILRRRCSAAGKETCEVINRVTNKPEFAGLVPGEAIFGVSEEIFSRTLFFRQLTVPQPTDDILADRLRDIAISADEQVSTKKAIKRLTDAKNELKGKMGNGLIPKAEAERDELDEKITLATDLRREADRLNGELNKRSAIIQSSEGKLKALNGERRNMEKYDSFIKLQNIARLKQDENDARAEYEAVSSGLLAQADSGVFSELTAQHTALISQQHTCESLKERLDNAEKEVSGIKTQMPMSASEAEYAEGLISSSKNKSTLCFALAALCAVAGVALFFLSTLPVAIGTVAFGGVLAALGVIILLKPSSYAKGKGISLQQLKSALEELPALERRLSDGEARAAQAKTEYQRSVSDYSRMKTTLESEIGKYLENDSTGDYTQRIQQILSLSSAVNEKKAVWQLKLQEYEQSLAGVDIDALAEDAKGAEKPERERATVDMEINFYTQQLARLTELNHRDELELAACEAKSGDVAVMIGKRDAISNTVDDLVIKHKAYERAIELINDAGSYMKSMVAPRISARADDYFSAATDGKYNSLEIDTRVSMSFGEDIQRSCDYLSAGTRDSAYLSLRLALADLLFADGAPVILDDAFVRLDNDRLNMMSKALGEASDKHQIFIFTHSDREASAMEQTNTPYSTITIKS